MQELVFKSISDFHAYNGMPEPENPLFSVSSYSGKEVDTKSCDEGNNEVSLTCGFYSISLKKILSGELVYGRTKYDGEVNVREKCLQHLIVRCSWVYASRGRNFVMSTMDLMKKQDTLHVVDDQIGAPTWARNIADASTCMIRSVISPGKINSRKLFGTYHLSSDGICSWYEFSKSIVALLEKHGVPSPIETKPVSSDEYKSVTHRPSYSVLDCNKVSRVFSVRQVAWQYALELCIAEMRIREKSIAN